MMRRAYTLAAVLLLSIAASALDAPVAAARDAADQQPSLEQVLARAADYVQDLHAKVSGIVAEETYLQQARGTRSTTLAKATDQRKTLKSDLLLIRPPDADRYIEFRDVFQVNDTPVRDRQERLTKLFLTPTQATADQIKTIADESARHNIGNVMRNVNTPMLSLHFLWPVNQTRFRFRRQNSGSPELATATDFPRMDATRFNPPADAWVIEYRETTKPTVIKTHGAKDLPANGRYWLEPSTGAVLLSELVLRTTGLHVVIDVSYQSEPLLGFRVPVEMRERYRATDERVEGIATYGRFRQFQVKTAETIGKPPGGLQ
jgi:hypothetical protein